MKINKLWIRNYRGFGPGGVWEPLSDLNESNAQVINLEKNIVFLTGKNNTSKSTVLNAYDLYFKSKSKVTKSDFYMSNEANSIVIQAEIMAELGELEPEDAKWHDENGIALIRRIWRSDNSDSEKESYNVQSGIWVKNGYKGFDTLLQKALPDPIFISGYMSSSDVINQLNSLMKHAIISKISNSDKYKELQGIILDLQEEMAKSGYAQKITGLMQSQLEKIFPGYSVHFEVLHDEAKIPSLFPGADISVLEEENKLPLEHHGHGLRRQFVLNALHGMCHEIKRLKTSKPKELADQDYEQDPEKAGKVILFEEPELFLHPSAMRSVRDLLYEIADSGEFQIIAATHSPVLIDLSRDHQSIVRSRRGVNGAIINQVYSNIFDGDEKKKLSMINKFNPYANEAFFSDRVVLVEGDTEQTVIRSLLEKWAGQYDGELHVLNCGTKNNIPLFQKILRHFSIEYEVIHDLDARLNKSGGTNSAWTINHSIWDEIETAREQGVHARGFIHNRNFEMANGVASDGLKGKPLSALEGMESWNTDPNESEKPIVKYISTILGLSNSLSIFYRSDLERLDDMGL
jgi:predicted ATP-dependent endonuclease of OLD family